MIPTCIRAHAGMHAGMSNWWLKSMAGKTFPAFQAHAQPTNLRIWQEVETKRETHHDDDVLTKSTYQVTCL